MINQKINLRYSCRRAFLTALSIIFLMAMGGIIGCSSSSGDSSTYHMIGYDGVTDSESASSVTLLEAGNSGLTFLAQAPWYVNMTFQVNDGNGLGVSGLKATDFIIHENDALLDTIESNINIRKRNLLPPEHTYQLKTVLLIDNSSSVSPETLNKILEAAQAILNNIDKAGQQEVAIVAFDNDGDPELINDFTIYTTRLLPYLTPDGPRAIGRSFGAANFYGAVQYALGLWEENPSPASKALAQGFVVAITQGNDVAGFYGVNDAIAARDKDSKRVVTVPVGANIPANILADMERLGNGWYYPVPNTDNLMTQMETIQNRMLAFADAFYWIQYKSEQFGAPGARLDHTIEVAVTGNPNAGDDAKITGSFSSRDFIVGEGVYFNANAANPSGINKEGLTFMLERGQAAGAVTDELSALTYSRTGKVPSQFTWTSLDNNVVGIAPKSGTTTAAVITVNNTGETFIRVTDTANGVSANLKVKVLLREFSYEILQHELESAAPWNVDATFQVREADPTDNQWKWITNMKREEFTLIENNGPGTVDLETSEVNLRKRNRLPSDYSYTLKTVLLIDNSPSTDADGDNLALMKEAAKAFVNRVFVDDPDDSTDKGPLLNATGGNQQEIAVWSFSQYGDSRLVQNFTTDRTLLNAAIDGIPRGFGPINFYGGMVDSLRLWQNNQAPRTGGNQLRQGVLVVLTDGWESLTGFVNKNAVLGEIKDNKQVICVGVADDLVTRADINTLKLFGNAGYYSVPEPAEDLSDTLRHIQDEIVDYANSFYWLNYKSYIFPAGNCANTSNLEISINDNSNPDQQSISGEFETCAFFDGVVGEIYVNSTATNPWGEEEFVIQFAASAYPLFADWVATYGTPTVPLEAVTYDPLDTGNAPNYAWSSSNSNTVIVVADTTTYANARAVLRLPANPRAGTAQVRVRDQGNNTEKTLTVRVEQIDIPEPIAHYPFTGDALDATGNGYDGEVFGPKPVADRFKNPNSAYSFNATGITTDHIALNMFYGPADGSDAWAGETIDRITVGAWVKSASEKSQYIVSFDAAEYWTLSLKADDEENVGWDVRNTIGTIYGLRSADDYSNGTWHFVVATYDSDISRLYVDGLQVASRAVDGSIGTGLESWGFIGVGSLARSYNGDIDIPDVWWMGGSTLFRGDLDDVMIFHLALTPDQVASLYQISK